MSKDKAPREAFLKIIQEWKWYWMNQTQNSEADYLNYQSRAHGIDANMKYDLADRLATRETALEAKLKERDEFIEVRGKHLIEIADERDALKAKLAECVAALTDVIAVADRNTNEFNYAREVLAKVKK